jgi:hypothetical protein
MSPIEKNARCLVGVLAQHFPGGATCEDLRRQFEKDTSLARQSFYNSLSYAKEQHWIVGGGRDRRDQYQLYALNADASWKEPVTSIGEGLEKDRLEYLADSQAVQIQELQGELECLRNWTGSDANGEANVALSSLIRIVGDSAASTRQRIRASAAVLGYKVHDDGVTEFVKRFLESVCADADIATDYRIEAGELLRRHEAPRVMSESVRPTYRENEGSEASRKEAWRKYEIAERELRIVVATRDVPPEGWADDLYSDNYLPPAEGWPGPAPVIPLKDLVVARRTRADRMELELLASPDATPQMKQATRAALRRRNGNGNGDDASDD